MAKRRKKKRNIMTASLARMSQAVGSGSWSLLAGACRWGVEYFLRAPMASTGLILVAGLTLMAGTNALFFQETRHPAPLFADLAASRASTPQPLPPEVVEPQSVPPRPEAQSASPALQPAVAPAAQTAASEPAQETVLIGNQDIADLQSKLKALGMFQGTVDGYYGPKTADAIRLFEGRNGMPRTGAATPQVLEAVKNAPLAASQAPAADNAPVAAPAPQQVASEPAADAIAPLLAEMREEAAPAPVEARAPEPARTADASVPPALDEHLVSDIQRGLARLGFLQGPVNGTADEVTARAIRKFQIFNNYTPTGEVSPLLRDMLVAAGAYI